MSIDHEYNKAISGAIQKLDKDLSMYDELIKNTSISRAMMGETLRKSVATVAFSIAKMDNGFLVLFNGPNGGKHFVAKTGNEILEIVAGQLTASRLSTDNTNTAGDCEAAQSA